MPDYRGQGKMQDIKRPCFTTNDFLFGRRQHRCFILLRRASDGPDFFARMGHWMLPVRDNAYLYTLWKLFLQCVFEDSRDRQIKNRKSFNERCAFIGHGGKRQIMQHIVGNDADVIP